MQTSNKVVRGTSNLTPTAKMAWS